jgi:Lon protease-like protein
LSLVAELGAEVPPAGPGVAPDPAVAAWQLLAMAPIMSLDKHRLLAVDDPIERLQLLATRAEEQATLLAYRLNRE